MVKIKKYILIILILSLAIFSCSTSNETVGLVARSQIQDNYLIFDYGSYEIRFSSRGDDLLYIESSATQTNFAESPFFLNIEPNYAIPKETEGKYLLSGYQIEPIKSGFRVFENDNLLYESTYSLAGSRLIEQRLNGEELQFGMGHNSNNIVRSNEKLRMYHYPQYGHRTNMYVPFNFTSEGDSFYYNTATNDSFDFGSVDSGSINISSNTGTLSYYFFKEETPKDSVIRFYEISKSKSLLPQWAYGFIQSKYGYRNNEEVFNIVEEFEQREIPLSAIVLDLYWFEYMGDLDWNRNAWDPIELENYLSERDIKLITISEPFISSYSSNFDAFSEAGILALDAEGEVVRYKDWWCFNSPDGSIMNPIAPNSYDLWGSFYSQRVDDGVDGFWMDLGEPENVPEESFFNEYSEYDFHNYYNMTWVDMVYNSLLESHPNKRPFLLNRSGFTGAAGKNVSHWSGDVPTTFQGLKDQVGLALNDSFAGFSYWGSDVGGFTGSPESELFLRWFQFGAWTPVFRAHGNSPREPWIFGDEITELVTDAIVQREIMLPYIYSTAWQTYLQGLPMMRSMFFESENRESWALNDQYMFGDFFLIAPILEEISKSGQRSLYLPEETNWYTWPELKTVEETGSITIDTSDLSKIPVYIKEGAILPLDREGTETYLLIASDTESSFIAYSDDGESNDYLAGEYEELKIELNSDRVTFSGATEARMVSIELFREGIMESYSLEIVPGSVELLF